MADLLGDPPVPPQASASPLLPVPSRRFIPPVIWLLSRASLSLMGIVLIRLYPGSAAASKLISVVLPAVTPSSRFDIVLTSAGWMLPIWNLASSRLLQSVCGQIFGHVEGELSMSLLPLFKSNLADFVALATSVALSLFTEEQGTVAKVCCCRQDTDSG
ncbi:hypothetical protein Nepgr_004071 [Nepenthes gracilis]|uniref:Uncharacterized protein n=1 Tax=Nepenthes gracilis TaxID=150966 RepID=A0AAD3XEP0_NEPGR|nr:hypothetical protein Nepgr_004071 [Nepenthes gracilis]